MRAVICLILGLSLLACDPEKESREKQTDRPKEPENFEDFFKLLQPSQITANTGAVLTEKELKGLAVRRKRGDWLVLERDTIAGFINLQYESTGNNIGWKYYRGSPSASVFLRSMGGTPPSMDFLVFENGKWLASEEGLPQVTVGDFLDTGSYLYKKEAFSRLDTGITPYFDEDRNVAYRLHIPTVMYLADSLYQKFVPERDIVRKPWLRVENGGISMEYTQMDSDWKPSYEAVFAFHSGEDLPGWDACLNRVREVIGERDITLLTGKSYEKSILLDVEKGPLIDISAITGEDEVFEGYILIREGSRNRYVPYGSCGRLLGDMKRYFHIKDEEKE